MKISSYESVASQKYENGYRTKIVILQYVRALKSVGTLYI